MDTRLALLLFGSYLGVVITVVGGVTLMPELFTHYPNRGISFWGNYFPAVVPYSFGLLITTVCLSLTAYILPDYPERLSVMKRLLLAIAFGLMIILVTPEQANMVFYWAHTLAAIYLFVVAAIGTGWIMLHAGKTTMDWILFWSLVVGTVLSFFSASYIRVFGYLAVGQVLALNACSLILIRATLRWTAQEVKE